MYIYIRMYEKRLKSLTDAVNHNIASCFFRYNLLQRAVRGHAERRRDVELLGDRAEQRKCARKVHGDRERRGRPLGHDTDRERQTLVAVPDERGSGIHVHDRGWVFVDSLGWEGGRRPYGRVVLFSPKN